MVPRNSKDRAIYGSVVCTVGPVYYGPPQQKWLHYIISRKNKKTAAGYHWVKQGFVTGNRASVTAAGMWSPQVARSVKIVQVYYGT